MVNLAARLETASRPGHVLIGPGTAEHLAGFASLTPVGPLSLRGVAGPVQAWEVVGLEGRGSDQQ